MIITITRSFSRTKQIAAYEPISASCTASTEVQITTPDTLNGLVSTSDKLDAFVRSEVEKTIQSEIAKHTAQVEAAKEANKF